MPWTLNIVKRALVILLLCCGILGGSPAHAVDPSPLPPETMILSPGGVDLRSATYKVSKVLLSVGQSQTGGIEFKRMTRTYGVGAPLGKMGQFNHNWDIRFQIRPRAQGAGSDVSVTSDELSYNFFDTGGTTSVLESEAGYATLTRTTVGSDYYYTLATSDGTVVTSNLMAANGLALAASVVRANGISFTLSYDSSGPSGAPRLRNVVSSAGYALVMEYLNFGSNSFVARACVLNLSQTTLPSGNVCPSGASSVSYSYSGQNLSSETDAKGEVWNFGSTYTGPPNDFQETYYLPGASAPYLTVNYAYEGNQQYAVEEQTFADGHTYSYGWGIISSDAFGNIYALVPIYYEENGGPVTYVNYGVYRSSQFVPPKITPGPQTVTDALNRTTTFDYCLSTCSQHLLKSKTLPLGMTATYTYDAYRNITQVSTTPSTGSGLSPIVVGATYDCSTLTFCSKPTATTDANGNQTDYAYSSTHGQILSKTSPAVGGVRPQTRYIYAQRYAWIAASGGGYVHGSSPMWMLAQESLCKTGAAAPSGVGCVIPGDEVVTTYDYGPDSGPNTLLLRGTVVDAGGLSLRTCYGYNGLGRKISETAPRAGLTSCP